MHSTAKKPVDEMLPSFNILYFIKEYMRKVTIQLIKAFKYGVEIIRSSLYKLLILEIDICEDLPRAFYHIYAKNRFPGTPDTYNHLSHSTIKINKTLFRAMAPIS